jgi:hypothetical protein
MLHPMRSCGRVSEPQIEVFEGPGAGEAFAFAGTPARSRNKDGMNVLDATTAFKTVACLNVTLAMRKLVAQFWWLAVAPIVVVM